MSVVERFINKVRTPDGEQGCWLWTGAIGSDGYGRVRRKGKTHSAHRYAYQLFKGDVPQGLCVLHRCDNPACVNPTHLFLGTKKDNSEDMLSKGRHGRSRPHLTREDVEEIRQRLAAGESKVSVARAYGMCRSTVQDIEGQRTWGSRQSGQLTLFESAEA